MTIRNAFPKHCKKKRHRKITFDQNYDHAQLSYENYGNMLKFPLVSIIYGSDLAHITVYILSITRRSITNPLSPASSM